MKFMDYISEERVFINVPVQTKEELFTFFIEQAVKQKTIPTDKQDILLKALLCLRISVNAEPVLFSGKTEIHILV